VRWVGLAVALVVASQAAEFPEASIANGQIQAKLYLPDAEHGYYRATRFDWSGVVASLTYKGHSYFGVWFPKYDPKLHDAITGPVEEFRTGDSGLGYKDAPVGGRFVRIGVGVLRKPEEARFDQFKTYEILDSGKWSVKAGKDAVTFTQKLQDAETGYGYLYRKTVRLEKDSPRMVIEHSLKNTGTKTIETNVYSHNFYVIDGTPSGPDMHVKFPFELKASVPFRGPAGPVGKEMVYREELAANGGSVYGELAGFGDSSKDFDIRVENGKTGAGVRLTGDKPLARVVFWSIRTVLSPEPYIEMRIEPGKEAKWVLKYEFYVKE
jgi:hypothetical protein